MPRTSDVRRRRRGGLRDVRFSLRNRRTRRLALAALGVMLLLYIFYVALLFVLSSLAYADVGVGDRRDAVLYGVGRPAQSLAASGAWEPRYVVDAPAWAYSNATGGRVEVRFGTDDAVERIACSEPNAVASSCPDLFRVGLGDDEGTLTRRLGSPTSERLDGEVKIMRFAGIGAEYRLRRYVVYEIAAVRSGRSHPVLRLGRLLHNLIP